MSNTNEMSESINTLPLTREGQTAKCVQVRKVSASKNQYSDWSEIRNTLQNEGAHSGI